MIENQKEKFADLHVHTNFSDGTFTPEEVVQQAGNAGLSCISITDHDEVSGVDKAKESAGKGGIEIIPGVEFAAEAGSYEIHILGYFIDCGAYWFKEKLKEICDARKKRALAIVEKLKSFDIELDADELLRQAGPGAVGRLHIARMLRKKGYVFSIQEAFNKYIGNQRSCYVKRFKLTSAEAIKLIRKAKGIAVLAHPYHIGNDDLIAKLVQQGLRGIEVYYPEHNVALTEHYQNLAKKYGLLITGGSDSHGLAREKEITLGKVKIPYSLVEALKKEAKILK